jgi:FkbM family methyltransferase
MLANLHAQIDLDFVCRIASVTSVDRVVARLPDSKSQLRQDLMVLAVIGWKESGYFVEFGATNGVDLSNTFLLETSFNWTGIVAEPARGWHSSLKHSRRCVVDTRCVWSETGASLLFKEVKTKEYSTIDLFSASDFHRSSRGRGETYLVDTVSLIDLLNEHKAPVWIDYLSMDTEGSEFEILRTFDFSKYFFRVISVEHNFGSTREKIHDLLTKNGYSRILEEISHFDDWYIPTGAVDGLENYSRK